jgi:class 3 adenylate cyclase
METKLMAVMFADVSGFTKFSSTSKHESLSVAVGQIQKLMEPVITRHRGRLVKWIGDAAMAVFDSATDSIFCGHDIQKAFLEGGERSNTSIGLGIKVVVNVGDIAVDRDGDVYGAPVNFCSRMEKCAEPEEVFFSEAVRRTIPQAEIPCELFGEYEFKGVPGKHPIYRTCFGRSPVLRERILLVKTDFVGVLALADSHGWDVVHPALDQAIGLLKFMTRKNNGTFRGTGGTGTLVTFPAMRDALLTFHEWREAIQGIHPEALPENSVKCRVAMHVGTLHLMEHTLMGKDIHVVETLTPLGNANDVLMTQEARKLFDAEFRDASVSG